MRKYHIRLNTSTFHSSKLIKKLPEDTILSTLPYHKTRINSSGISSRKQNEGNLI